MRVLLVAVVLLVGCKSRHITLRPGPPATLDPSPNPTLPTTDPAVEARMQGGIAGGYHWRIQLWSDGTVGFSGELCHGTHRATLPPARVAELVDALRELDFDDGPTKSCADAFQFFVRVGSHSWLRSECAEAWPALDNAYELIRTALGTMPCDPTALTTR